MKPPRSSETQGQLVEDDSNEEWTIDENGAIKEITQSFQLQQGNIYSFSAWVKLKEGEDKKVEVVFRTENGKLVHGGEVRAKQGCWTLLKGGPVYIFFESEDKDAKISVSKVSLKQFTKQEWKLKQSQLIQKMPADMVVNSMLVAMAAQANKKKESIYHVGSSYRNPCRNKVFPEGAYRYFTSKPWIGKDGKPVHVKKIEILSSMSSFHRYMAIHYSIPLKGLELANMIFCKLLDTKFRKFQRKFNFVLRLVDLYKPYIFFNGVFDDTNTGNLQIMVSKMETEMFDFDPKDINWDDYIENIHIPGLVRYVF